ncbi:hypothetical protein HWV62_2671 [Athelia sp. TMB]|nr:hypothetical protein HWV62_2671 [Athelia sp. TMB]
MTANAAQIALGPMMIGTLLNLMLYGVMVIQVHTYFMTYPKDRLWFKALVVFLLIADTANAVFDTVFVYDALVVHWGESPLIQGIIAACVQFFFAWRILIITRSKLATLVVVIGTLANFLAGVGTAIAVGMIPEFERFVEFEAIVIIWLVAAAVTDLCITFALCYHLHKHKTGFPATDDLVNRVIRLTMQTGALTATFAIIDLILFLVDPTATGWKFGSGEASSADVITIPSSKVHKRQTMSRPEVFMRVEVERHEMHNIEQEPNAGKHLFPDNASNGAYTWDDTASGGDIKGRILGSDV